MEKTQEMILKKSELYEIRRSYVVCSHCGAPFLKEEDSFCVCETCIKKAMEEESFIYEKG